MKSTRAVCLISELCVTGIMRQKHNQEPVQHEARRFSIRLERLKFLIALRLNLIFAHRRSRAVLHVATVGPEELLANVRDAVQAGEGRKREEQIPTVYGCHSHLGCQK